MDTCKTVRIQATHESQGPFVEINEADFDPAVHKLAADPYPNLSPAQEEALDHINDGIVKPGGSPKGGNRRKAAK
jgi:hypothetical protein